MIDFDGSTQDDEWMTQIAGGEDRDRSRDRQGSVWVGEDYAVLVDGLRQGLADEDLAKELGRTASSVHSRARFLLPTDKARSGRALETLRVVLVENADYPWESHARESHRAKGQPFWGEAEDDVVRTGWEKQAPLPDIASSLDVAEEHVVRRLITLRLAENTLAVTDRLGCAPEGYVDLRRRLMADRQATSVWVLVVNDLDGDEPVHLSLHPTRQAAVKTRDALIAGNEEGQPESSPWWCIGERVPGSPVGDVEVSDWVTLPPSDAPVPSQRDGDLADRVRHVSNEAGLASNG